MAGDPVVEAVRKDLLDRSTTGMAKYGTTLARTDLKLVDWLRHAYEEALDLANYLKRSIIEIESRADGGADIVTRHLNIAGQSVDQAELDRLRGSEAHWGRIHQQAIEGRAAALRENAALSARITELLNHNNELLERARKAERKQRERH